MMNLLKTQNELDKLAREFDSVKSQLKELQEREATLVERLGELADAHLEETGKQKKKGTVTLKGDNWDVKVTKRINIRYPQERGAPHPLLEATRDFNELMDLINISATEKGQDIQKMIDRIEKEGASSPLEARLIAIREETPGKPGIEVIKKKG